MAMAELKIPSELILRAARRITPNWDTASRNERRNAIITAREVIAALKYPPENVIDALNSRASCDGFTFEGWNAAIDIAMGQEIK